MPHDANTNTAMQATTAFCQAQLQRFVTSVGISELESVSSRNHRRSDPVQIQSKLQVWIIQVPSSTQLAKPLTHNRPPPASAAPGHRCVEHLRPTQLHGRVSAYTCGVDPTRAPLPAFPPSHPRCCAGVVWWSPFFFLPDIAELTRTCLHSVLTPGAAWCHRAPYAVIGIGGAVTPGCCTLRCGSIRGNRLLPGSGVSPCEGAIL